MAKARKKAREEGPWQDAQDRHKAHGEKVHEAQQGKGQVGKPAKKKASKAKRRVAKPPEEGPVAGAIHAVVDTIRETAQLRSRLVGRDSFEDT